MKMNSNRKKRGRTVRVTVAIVCSLAMVMTTALSGVAFAKDGATWSDDDIILVPGAMDGIGNEDGVNVLRSNGVPYEGTDILRVPIKDGKADTPLPIASGVNASGTISFPSFNPGKDAAVSDAANVAQLSTTKAGGNITVAFVGKNQDLFFQTCNLVDSNTSTVSPANTPALGTIAYIPTDYQDGFGHSKGYYSYYSGSFNNDYSFDGPAFTYSGPFTKAAALWIKIYYQKWTVKDNLIQSTTNPDIQVIDPAQPRKWEAEMTTRYVKQFNYDLLGMVNYVESSYERGKTFKTSWLKNGATYPKVTPRRSGFKFNGWYTKWPKGSKVKVGSAKVWFGSGYTKTLYVHWKKKVKITYNPSKGKITKGKKVVKVNYLGKLGKAPTVARSGYYGLGWFRTVKYKDSYGNTKKQYDMHNKKLIVAVPKATFSAHWIKSGSGKTVKSSEWNRLVNTAEKGIPLKYKAVKAAIGGGGTYDGEQSVFIGTDGYYNYYVRCKIYEWNGNVDGTIVKGAFRVSNGYLLAYSKNGGLK